MTAEEIANLEKQEALEAKALKKENAKNKATESNAKNAVKSNATSKVKETKEQTEIQDPSLCLNCGCVALLKTGLRKGEACGQKAFESNLCKRHCPK